MNLIITCGVPGSGKTTWAREKALSMGNTLLFSRDDLRESLYGGIGSYRFSTEKEELISNIEQTGVRLGLASGKNVIVHDTNCKPGDKAKWLAIAKECNADFHIEYFDVHINELLKRNKTRGEKHIPPHRIWAMYKNYRMLRGWTPAIDLALHTNPKCVIFDVDGTLVRMGDRSPLDFTKVLLDPPNKHVIDLFAMYEEQGYFMIIVSGREGTEQCRKDTEESLRNYGVFADSIFMREEGDRRPDFDVKEEILFNKIIPNYLPIIAFDDRDTPVGMWRINGIPCMQVEYGDF